MVNVVNYKGSPSQIVGRFAIYYENSNGVSVAVNVQYAWFNRSYGGSIFRNISGQSYKIDRSAATYAYVTIRTARNSYIGSIDLREVSQIMIDVGFIKGTDYLTAVKHTFITFGYGEINTDI